MSNGTSQVLFLAQSISVTNTSVPKFQYGKYICSNYNTTLVVKRREAIDPALLNEAQRVYSPPGGTLLRSILYPILVIMLYFRMFRRLRFVATSDQGETVFPTLLLSNARRITDLRWIVFAWDVPNAMSERRDSYLNEISIASIYNDFMTNLTRRAYASSDLIILSDDSKSLRKKHDHIEVIPAGADCEKISAISVNNDKSEKPRLVYAGNMYYHRGIDILLEAVEMCDSEFTLVLIGNTPNDATFESQLSKPVEEMVSDLSIDCEFLGFLESHEDVLREIKKSEIGICLLPSGRGVSVWVENAYPIKLSEYMASGIAVVATKTTQTERLLSEEQLVKSDSPEELAGAIDNLLSDPELLSNSRELNLKSSNLYCWGHIYNEIDSIIDKKL